MIRSLKNNLKRINGVAFYKHFVEGKPSKLVTSPYLRARMRLIHYPDNPGVVHLHDHCRSCHCSRLPGDSGFDGFHPH